MSEEFIGLIPAAGKGVRLGLPYPKELYPVIRDNQYKPISQFVVENLTTAGIGHIAFVVNETKHQLMAYFGSGQRFNCDISYVVQEQRIKDNESTSPGLAHALNSAYHLIKNKTVFFGMADTIMQPNDCFKQAYDGAETDDDVIFVLFPTERPEKFGMVDYEADGRVNKIVDKPKQTDLKDMWGGIIWRPRFTEHLNECVAEKQISDFALIMNSAIEKGMRFRAVLMEDSTYIDLGTYDEIMELESRFREVE